MFKLNYWCLDLLGMEGKIEVKKVNQVKNIAKTNINLFDIILKNIQYKLTCVSYDIQVGNEVHGGVPHLYTPRYGELWCGELWCGELWCGELWCGELWCGELWCGELWCGELWCGDLWCGDLWYGDLWYGGLCEVTNIFIIC